MDETQALPTAQEVEAGGTEPTLPDQLTEQNPEGVKPEDEPKPEKTEAERERARMQRGIDRKTRQAAEARAEAAQLRRELDHLRQTAGSSQNEPQDDDSPVTLTRAQMQEAVKREAEKLAPTLTQQRKEAEHRTGIVESLAKDLGQERFDALAADLDEALGGLADRSGRPKPATDAIFEADNPRAVIEYLADEENEADAEALARMTPSQAGRFIARLEDKLAAKKAEDKPKVSKAPAPIEPVRGQGGNTNSMPSPSDTKAWIRWRNEQDKQGL